MHSANPPRPIFTRVEGRDMCSNDSHQSKDASPISRSPSWSFTSFNCLQSRKPSLGGPQRNGGRGCAAVRRVDEEVRVGRTLLPPFVGHVGEGCDRNANGVDGINDNDRAAGDDDYFCKERTRMESPPTDASPAQAEAEGEAGSGTACGMAKASCSFRFGAWMWGELSDV